MKLNFKKWFNENITSTADVANFALPFIRTQSKIKLINKKSIKKSKEREHLV